MDAENRPLVRLSERLASMETWMINAHNALADISNQQCRMERALLEHTRAQQATYTLIPRCPTPPRESAD